MLGSQLTPRVPSALPQHQIVPVVANAHVVPEPGELMLCHLAGRFGIVVTEAFAGAALVRTGKPVNNNERVASNVGINFFMVRELSYYAVGTFTMEGSDEPRLFVATTEI